MDYVSFYLSAAWALWRIAGHGTGVVAKTDPSMISLVAAPIARLRGAVLVNWLQDLFPEVTEALGLKLTRRPRGVGSATYGFGPISPASA